MEECSGNELPMKLSSCPMQWKNTMGRTVVIKECFNYSTWKPTRITYFNWISTPFPLHCMVSQKWLMLSRALYNVFDSYQNILCTNVREYIAENQLRNSRGRNNFSSVWKMKGRQMQIWKGVQLLFWLVEMCCRLLHTPISVAIIVTLCILCTKTFNNEP